MPPSESSVTISQTWRVAGSRSSRARMAAAGCGPSPSVAAPAVVAMLNLPSCPIPWPACVAVAGQVTRGQNRCGGLIGSALQQREQALEELGRGRRAASDGEIDRQDLRDGAEAGRAGG